MSDTDGMVCWTELKTTDPKAAQEYCGSVCGWTFETIPAMEAENPYVLCNRGDGKPIMAGIFDTTGIPMFDGLPPHWFTYFAVGDVDAAVKKAVAAGGTVQREPFDIQGVGRIAIITDVVGAAKGLMTPA